MEGPFQQLRFNISEKVRLQPQQPGIRTLLELDLYPDVEIKDENKHLKIQGYLRLHGQYLGDQLEYEEQDDVSTLQAEEIAYVIPVEITLPADKVAIDYIEAEIESFDYQIHSEFELQVDAILTIDGILPDETEQIRISDKEQEPALEREHHQEPLLESEEVNVQKEEKGLVEKKKEEARKEEAESTNSRSVEVHREDNSEQKASNPNKVAVVESEMPADAPEVIQEETAFDSPELNIEIDEREEASSEEAKASEEEKEGEKQPLSAEHWAKWLIREQEEKSFTPVRMVIVQQEESVDTLANRYDVSANVLIDVNDLNTDRLEQGQIIQIPGNSERQARGATGK